MAKSMRVSEARAELARVRKELEFIEGQLHNERVLETCECAELTVNEIDRLEDQNEKLMTEVIVLETMLEE